MAFTGVPLSGFSDFQKITGPGILKSPADFPNEAQDRTYLTAHWLRNMTGMDHLQGGTRPQEYIMKDDGSTASNNLFSQMRSTNDPQVMVQVNTEWRLTEDSMAPNVIVHDLNEGGGGDMRRRFMQYKSEDAKQKRRLATSYCNKFERDWIAQPDVSKQVGTAGATDPSPFWLYVNEYGATFSSGQVIFDPLNPTCPAGLGRPNGFTTIDGLDPSTEPYWRCWQLAYDFVPTTSIVQPGASNWITAMTKAMTLMQYNSLPWHPSESTTNNPVNDPEYICPVSTNGNAYVHAMSEMSSNFFRSSPTDLYYPHLSFAGIPFVPVQGMDTAAVYPTTVTTAPAVGAGVTENAATAANRGPRFPLLSRRHLQWIMHSKYNFYQWPVRSPSRQWDVEITPITTLHNRLCMSRRKMAMVFPGDVTNGDGTGTVITGFV